MTVSVEIGCQCNSLFHLKNPVPSHTQDAYCSLYWITLYFCFLCYLTGHSNSDREDEVDNLEHGLEENIRDLCMLRQKMPLECAQLLEEALDAISPNLVCLLDINIY